MIIYLHKRVVDLLEWCWKEDLWEEEHLSVSIHDERFSIAEEHHRKNEFVQNWTHWDSKANDWDNWKRDRLHREEKIHSQLMMHRVVLDDFDNNTDRLTLDLTDPEGSEQNYDWILMMIDCFSSYWSSRTLEMIRWKKRTESRLNIDSTIPNRDCHIGSIPSQPTMAEKFELSSISLTFENNLIKKPIRLKWRKVIMSNLKKKSHSHSDQSDSPSSSMIVSFFLLIGFVHAVLEWKMILMDCSICSPSTFFFFFFFFPRNKEEFRMAQSRLIQLSLPFHSTWSTREETNPSVTLLFIFMHWWTELWKKICPFLDWLFNVLKQRYFSFLRSKSNVKRDKMMLIEIDTKHALPSNYLFFDRVKTFAFLQIRDD